jgi:hypothetical protein
MLLKTLSFKHIQQLFSLTEGKPSLLEVLPLWWQLTTWTWLLGTLQVFLLGFMLTHTAFWKTLSYQGLMLIVMGYVVYVLTQALGLWLHWCKTHADEPWSQRLLRLGRFVLVSRVLDWLIFKALVTAVSVLTALGIFLLQWLMHARLPLSELPLNEALMLVLLLAIPFATLGQAFVLRWVMQSQQVSSPVNA